MSGRIRSIKPELLEDAVTAGLSDSAFRVFIGMILIADDYGNCRAETKYLEGQIYWLSIPEKSVEECLKEDGMRKLCTFYQVRGQSYAHLNGWDKHQKVQHAGKPRVPGIPESLMKPSGESHESLTPDLRPPITDHRPPSEGPPRDSHARLKSVPPPPAEDTPEAISAEEPWQAKPESGYDLAKRVFRELWSAKYREDYPFDWADSRPGSENRVLQDVGEMATAKPKPEAWLRHVVAGYLRDHGDRNWLDGKRHPLRTLKRDLASYGEPPTGKHRVAPKQPAEPVAPALSAAEVASKLGSIGMGKIGMGGLR